MSHVRGVAFFAASACLVSCGWRSWTAGRTSQMFQASVLRAEPDMPLEGDSVSLMLPSPCHGAVWTERRDGVTYVTVDPAPTPANGEQVNCAARVLLGPLAEGRYSVRFGSVATAFEVLSPTRLPDAWRVRGAVIRAHPEYGYHEPTLVPLAPPVPPPGPPVTPPAPCSTPFCRFWDAEFPDVATGNAQLVEVRRVGEREFLWAVKVTDACEDVVFEGSAAIESGGAVRIGDAHQVLRELNPC